MFSALAAWIEIIFQEGIALNIARDSKRNIGNQKTKKVL